MSILDYPPADSLSCETKFNLALKEPPMTIIAALRESPDSILIAADSQQIETDTTGAIRSATSHKLQLHPTLPMAWGISDNATIGSRFTGWLKQTEWRTEVDWYMAQQQIATQLAMLNGHQRQLCRLAGQPAQNEQLCGVLIVGFIDRVGVIFEIDASGLITIKDGHEFHAIGSGFIHAGIAYTTLMRIKSEATPEDKLRTIVGIAAETAPSCGVPVHLARITPQGCALLDGL